MTYLLTSGQMKAFETEAMERGTVTGLELMERAGRGVVEAVFSRWTALRAAPHRAFVFCGPGNNGGDGYVIARLLRDQKWEVTVYAYGDPARLPPDARANFERWDGPVHPVGELDNSGIWPVDLIVDALFGTGMTRGCADLEEVFSTFEDYAGIEALAPRPNGAPNPVVVAVDIPSGICADSGRRYAFQSDDWPEPDRMAHLTVSFQTAKTGHYLTDAPALCGELDVVDIGLDMAQLPRVMGALHSTTTPDWLLARLAEPPFYRTPHRRARLGKEGVGHKYDHGHALVLSGGAGQTGAARLAARGALRIGAGLVSVVTPDEALDENAAHLTAIMLKRAGDPDALRALLSDPRFNAICAGPGLGVARARALVPAILRAARRDASPPAVVLDADALTAFAEAPDTLFAQLSPHCILTPHMGEFRRLFPDLAEQLLAPAVSGPCYSRLDAVRDAAERAGCAVLLKGADTVIATPNGRASVAAALYDRAAPGLATAGSGDVLAGFITGLLARGFEPMQAAETAAWLHVETARSFGPGLIAEDLPEELPAVMRALEG